MLPVSVCIELIFPELDFLDRIPAVARAGFPAIEFWGWQGKNIDAIRESLIINDLSVSLFNLDPLVPVPAGESKAAFVQGVRASCRIAHSLECKLVATPVDAVNWGPGKPWYQYLDSEEAREQRKHQFDHVVEVLKEAARVASGEGITLLLEPLNCGVDHYDYFINTTRHAIDIIDAVGSPAVKVLFDIYHQQITEGNLITNLTENIVKIGHIHLADVPGRHEPGSGEINFVNILRAVLGAGYAGHFGLEYIPSRESGDSLESVRRYMQQVDEVKA